MIEIPSRGKINFGIVLGLLAILLFSSAASAAQELKVSTSRYSVFNPWLTNANYSFDLSGNFTAFALFLDNGLPVSGQDITFEIFANGTLISTQNNLTNQKGLASVSYDTIGQFTDRNDTDYGMWTITAYLTSNSAVTGSTDMNLEGWANTNTTTCGTHNDFCHKLTIISGSNNISGGNYPHSPYTGGYGNDTTFMEAAHQRSTHSSNQYRGCYICHPGYSVNKTGNYGSTNDVHKNRTCDFCHGNWTYIRNNLTLGGGAGVPKIPSCYDCHPIYNSNPSQISTLADLLPGPAVNVTGMNISVYSYNYDTKAPLSAHNGTESVPCVVCHGPVHNNSKPDAAPANTNTITEASQCISCHGEKHGIGTRLSCTVCHSQNAHIIQQAVYTNCVDCHPSYVSAWSSSKHNNSGAPNCTGCHTGYDVEHKGFIVNESNTCRNSGCHETKDERHRSSGSDCTQCHFANTTKPFSLNTSLSVNDHNLTIIRSFYQYNLTGAGNPLLGMPLTSNGGVGLGIFPYYSCTMASCHSHSNLKIENTSQTWLGSNHARSLRYPASSDNKNNCAKCKSPLNYNDSLNVTNPVIDAQDWQGINCRVCHNLHNRSFSTGAGPIAFYNATQSSRAGYDIYDKVANATELCEKCHNGNTHDSRYAGTHKDTIKLTCVSCHMNTSTGSFNFQNHMFEVKNETSGVTGCEVCHKAADHTFVYTANHAGKATCEACHDKTVSRNATGYATSPDGKTYGLYNDTATGEISSWKDSHGTPATWPLHNITRAVSCDKCHGTKSKPTGALLAPAILPHTGTGTCAQCHLGYPGSFVLPATNNCLACHTTNADTYGAPNIIGTSMAYYTTCNGGSCHGNDITDRLDTWAKHNVSRTFAGIGGYTDTVLLNNQGALAVTKGTIVTITSRVNDTMRYGGASRVGGAEYYIGTDPGQGKGTPMQAADGYYNALGANWESVTATINTSSLSNSTNTIYVRGRDIGNQWSAPKSATLLLISSGYINGTVNVTGGGPLSGATVSTGINSTTTSLDGSYSLRELTGTYTVTVSKLPTHYDNITIGVDVIDGSTRILNAALDERPTGNVTGSVTTV